jgi:hypothetical protein
MTAWFLSLRYLWMVRGRGITAAPEGVYPDSICQGTHAYISMFVLSMHQFLMLVAHRCERL